MKKVSEREMSSDIEKAVKRYAQKRAVVTGTVRSLEAACRALVAKRENALKEQIEALKVAKAALHDAIWEAPEWFDKSKTQTAHGVKFGYRKLPDHYEFDEAKTLKLIKREGDAFAALLIQKEEKVVNGALKGLDERALRGLKVKKVAGEEAVWIKDEAGESVQNLVNWLKTDNG